MANEKARNPQNTLEIQMGGRSNKLGKSGGRRSKNVVICVGGGGMDFFWNNLSCNCIIYF